MKCSWCRQPLPEDLESVPNLVLYDKEHRPMLQLHAECVRAVRYGLEVGERLVTN